MRYLPSAGLGALLFLAGCTPFKNINGLSPPVGPAVVGDAPTTESLIGVLNANAQRLQTVDCAELDFDCRYKIQPFGLKGWLVAEKPRNFRMTGKLMGTQMLDLGSNQEEFWFWVSKNDPPYLFHCSYQDFEQKQVKLPMPFQPEWLLEALGMAEYGAPEQYEVRATGNRIELIEKTTSPQGEPVQKVTVFSRAGRNSQPQVIGHILRDGNGKEICSAWVKQLQMDRTSGAVLPRQVKLTWPAEQLEMTLTLNETMVNKRYDPQQEARLFNRPHLANVPTFDLARGPDHPIRRVGGRMR